VVDGLNWDAARRDVLDKGSAVVLISSTHRHTQSMGTKNIAISDEAYQRLKALKKPGESFTEVIERMTRSRGILELAGTLSIGQAAQVKERIREIREDSSRRLQRTVEKVS
jgi:predicted CopG family antitoxin